MKRLISKITLIVMACITIVACFSFTACENKDTSKYNGTYYGYLDSTHLTMNGTVLEGTYTLTLKDGKWKGSDDTGNKEFFDLMTSGDFEVKDGVIRLYCEFAGRRSVFVGTIEENGFKFIVQNAIEDYVYIFKMKESE